MWEVCAFLSGEVQFAQRSRSQFVSRIYGITEEIIEKFSFVFKFKIEINYSTKETFQRRLNRSDHVLAKISPSLRLECKGDVRTFRENSTCEKPRDVSGKFHFTNVMFKIFKF